MTKLSMLFASAALLIAGAPSFANADQGSNDVRIKRITGSGSACRSSSSGRPINWAYTISGDGKTFSVDYSDFQVDERSSRNSCRLTLYVEFPAGRTSYAYSTQAFGEADVKSGDSATVTTTFQFGGERAKRTRTKIRGGSDGDVRTRAASARGSQNTRCGGKTVRVSVDVSADLRASKKSFLEITSTDGRLSNVRVKSKDCE